jgi:hypothetical protein
MSLEHMSATSPRNLITETHAHAPSTDRDAMAHAVAGDCHESAHAPWESAWIDIGGEG